MNKLSIIIFGWLIAIGCAFIADADDTKIKIAVAPLSSNDLTGTVLATLTERLDNELLSTGNYDLIGLAPYRQDLAKCLTNDCLSNFGQQHGIEKIIIGHIGRIGKKYLVDLRILDTKNNTVATSLSKDYECPADGLPLAFKELGRGIDSLLQVPAMLSGNAVGESLYVTSNYDSARVYLGDRYYGITPLKIRGLTVGSTSISIVKEKCREWLRDIVVTRGQMNTVQATLTYAKGALAVTSEPTGGKIFLNDKLLGETPMNIDNLMVGEYPLRVTCANFADHKSIAVVQENKTNRVAIAFTKKNSLFAESTPLGAAFYLNSTLAGKTPCTIDNLADCGYEIRIVKEGFKPWADSIKIQDGKLHNVNATLVPVYGSLAISSEPAGALVKLNGVEYGRTPCTIGQLTFAAYQVDVAKEGYEPIQRTVTIAEEKPCALHFGLVKSKAKISVLCNIGQADILLDDRFIGTTPCKAQPVELGQHTLAIIKNGYEPGNKIFSVDETAGLKEIIIELRPKTRLAAGWRSLVAPGWGQYYFEQNEKALLMAVTAGIGLAGYGVLSYSYGSLQHTYDRTMDAYRTASSLTDIDQYRAQANRTYGELKDKYRLLTIFGGACLGVWTINVLDAVLFSPIGGSDGNAGLGQKMQFELTGDNATVYLLTRIDF